MTGSGSRPLSNKGGSGHSRGCSHQRVHTAQSCSLTRFYLVPPPVTCRKSPQSVVLHAVLGGDKSAQEAAGQARAGAAHGGRFAGWAALLTVGSGHASVRVLLQGAPMLNTLVVLTQPYQREVFSLQLQ